MKEVILATLSKIAGVSVDSLGDDVLIRDIAGFDSLQFVMLISELQETHKIDVPLDKALEVQTVGELISCAQRDKTEI